MSPPNGARHVAGQVAIHPSCCPPHSSARTATHPLHSATQGLPDHSALAMLARYAGVPRSCPVSGLPRPQAMAMIMAKVEADPAKDRSFFAHHTPVLGVERMWALAEQAEAMYGTELTADVSAAPLLAPCAAPASTGACRLRQLSQQHLGSQRSISVLLL
jgi:hypothetical protein